MVPEGDGVGDEFEVVVDHDDEGHWEALAKQSLSFHDALAELIDNSISAVIPKGSDYFGSGGPSFRIQVTLEQRGDDVLVCVADEGPGMPVNQMSANLLKTGDRSRSAGILNEHGCGLKNALCVLTQNRQDKSFAILSKTVDQEKMGIIEGPFRKGMKGKQTETDELWKDSGDVLRYMDRGTRVFVWSTMKQLQGIYPRATKLDSLAQALREELGVTYRWFLQHSSSNHIEIRWKDENAGTNGALPVLSVFPEFETGTDANGRAWFETSEINVPLGNGDSVAVEYRRGIIDMEATRAKFEGAEYGGLAVDGSGPPLRNNYRGNQETQGVDIVLRGRTLNRHLLSELWFSDESDDEQMLKRHNRFNQFSGELVIQSDTVETVNNKRSLNEHHDFWPALRTALAAEEFRPRAWGSQEQEESLKVQLRRRLESEAGTERVAPETGAMGVNMDLVQYHNAGVQYIYEVKRGQAAPLDVYQCVMYWDAYSRLIDANLHSVTLVARGISTAAEDFLVFWNSRKDASDNDYNIQFRPLSDYGLG